MECLAAEMSKCVIRQVMRGTWGIKASGVCGLYDLQVEGGGCSILWRGWGWLFWHVWMWCDKGRDLKNDVEERHAGALVLWFVIACSSGCSAVSIEGAGNVDKAGGIVIEVAVAGGINGVSNSSSLRGVGKVVGCVDGIIAGAAVVVVDDGAVVDGKIIVIDVVVAVATAGIVDDAVANFVAAVDIDGVSVFDIGTGF